MAVKKYKLIFGIIVSVVFLSAFIFLAVYLLQKKIPEVLENLSAKHETINLVRINQGKAVLATKEQLQSIETRLNQEEIEYNEAKFQEELKKRQYDILAFENSLTVVEKPAKEICLTQERILGQWRIGNATKTEAYETTYLAKDKLEKVRKEIQFIRVPEQLPEPVKKLLEEARLNLAYGYDKKIEALDNLLKFIDENKPSFQHKFNDNLKASREFYASAALSAIEAKKRAGIELFNELAPDDESPRSKCSYTINGIFYSKNPFVFINEKVYYTNDPICAGRVINISPNKVIIRFPEGDKEYKVGDTATR